MENYNTEKWGKLFPKTIGNQTRKDEGVNNNLDFETNKFPQFMDNDPVWYGLQNAFLSQLFSNDERLYEFYKNYKKEIDEAIGNKTINDNIAADNKTGSLTNLLSKLGNMIKNITGKPNWYTAPATTLQALSDLIVDVASPNKLLKLDNNGKLPASITGDAHTVDGLHESAFMRVGTVNISTSDWNIITRAGCYDVGAETPFIESLHQPVGAYNYGVLLVSKGALNAGISQLYLAHNYNEIWCRAGYANTAWQEWKCLFRNGMASWASKAVDSDTVDGKHASDFATLGHTHNYAGSDAVGGKANSAKFADTAKKLIFSNNSQETELAWIYGEGTPDRVMGCSVSNSSKFIAFNPANFNVNYAKSSGNADTVDGKHASDFLLTSGGVLAENANLVIPSNWLAFSFIEKDGRIINSINKKQYDSKRNLIDIEVVDDNWYKALEIKTNGDIYIRGNGVITTEKFDFTIIYPNGGNAANPATVAVNSRYVCNNPFTGYHIICKAEVYYNNQWGETGFIYSPSFDGGYGTKATHLLPDDKIIIQTGNYAVLTVSCHAGNGFGILGHTPVTTPLPCRILVWKVGKIS